MSFNMENNNVLTFKSQKRKLPSTDTASNAVK